MNQAKNIVQSDNFIAISMKVSVLSKNAVDSSIAQNNNMGLNISLIVSIISMTHSNIPVFSLLCKKNLYERLYMDQ